MTPDVSIILVADYRAGESSSWIDFRRALNALAAQRFPGTFEILLVESAALIPSIPADVLRSASDIRVLPATGNSAYALINAGAAAARAPRVALLDADCTPSPDWLSHAVVALDADPGLAVVSGLTRYAGHSLTERCLAMLGRSHVDPGRAGATDRIAYNTALFRTAALRAHPLPEASGAFTARLQAQALRRDGWRFAFEPRMAVVHEFGGWHMERDIRERTAHALVAIRREDPSLPYAALLKLGLAAIPLLVLLRWADSVRVAWRTAHHHHVGRWQLPWAIALALPLHLLEVPGLARALRRLPPRASAYR